MPKINNITDLTTDLATNYGKLVEGKLTEKKAKEIGNLASKVIGSVKVQIEYNTYMKRKKVIKFLETK